MKKILRSGNRGRILGRKRFNEIFEDLRDSKNLGESNMRDDQNEQDVQDKELKDWEENISKLDWSSYDPPPPRPQKDVIQEKMKVLEVAKANLKKHFVGIDRQIDDVFSYLSPWYLCPQLLSRPIVINLWGPTGVGKTDLVRRLVSELDMAEKYLELDLTGETPVAFRAGGSTLGLMNHPTISNLLYHAQIWPNEPSILLVDEFQKYRTVSEDKTEKNNRSVNDIWMLMGDGKIPPSFSLVDLKEGIDELEFCQFLDKHGISEYMNDEGNFKNEEKGTSRSNSRYLTFASNEFSDLQKIKHVFNMQESVFELATWTIEKRIKFLREKFSQVSLYEHKVFSSMLIFVSGNIDEAYENALDTDSRFFLADHFHKVSKKVNIVQIKSCLLDRFRAEQIARLGNNHVIYPMLSSENYKNLISKNISNLQQDILNDTGISVAFDDSVKEMVFRNGVFPAQGTRPVFSTITNVVHGSFLNMLPFIYAENSNSIIIRYEDKLRKFVARDENEKEFEFSFSDALTEMEEDSANEDLLFVTSVHEAGHVLAHYMFFGCNPDFCFVTQVPGDSGMTSFETPPFTKKSDIKLQVMFGLAGTVAEEVVFGEDNISGGSSHDISTVTKIVLSAVKNLGFAPHISSGRIETCGVQNPPCIKTDERVEKSINDYLTVARNRICDILYENKCVLLKLSALLIKNKYVSKESLDEFFETEKDNLILTHECYSDYCKGYSKNEELLRLLKEF